jgi:hypothetical protein
MKKRAVILISMLAGGGDLATGLMLICAPAQTLKLMGVPMVRETVWMQYIGVFVACVGLTYIAGLVSWWRSGLQTRLQVVWEVTLLFRGTIGAFVGIEVLLGRLEPGWSMVAATDWFWAALQAVLLRGGFFEQR